jgi:nitronate monooxygenase
MSTVLDRLRYAIVAAPMAGGPSTPALVSAVSGAGGLGFLGAGYRTVERLAGDIAQTRELTGEPFGVNVFLPVDAADTAAVAEYARRMAPEAARYGVSPGEPAGGDDGYQEKVALLLREPVPVVSFSFGLPDRDTVAALRDRGTEVWATVTHPAYAEPASDLGVDAIVVQGVEAGAHRGGTDDTDDYGLLPLLRLVAQRVDTLLVGCGGVADGPGIAAVLAAGASAVALGTAFLRCPEAGTAPVHRSAVAGTGDTAVTRAFTGRRARGVVNRFLREHDAAAPAAYPQVHQVTQPIRAAARAAGDPQAVHLWAGQAHTLAVECPAGELVGRLAAAAALALRAATDRLA